jgi:hypothetical protein
MHVSRRRGLTLLVIAALAGSATTAISALGDGGPGRGGPGRGDNGRNDHRRAHATALLRTTLVPSIPADPALHGVAAGGAPWKLAFGQARLHSNGELRVAIQGLLLTTTGTTGPVTTVDAALYCGADTTAAATTPSVPLSATGNAFIDAQVALPATCLAPTLLINPNGAAAVYIAASGFGG